MKMSAAPETSTGSFLAVNAATREPCRLAMQDLYLTGKILPVGARLIVRHVFESAEKGPLEVVYSLGLPRDAALRRFRVVGEGFSVRSELRPTEEARETYEQALEEGHLGVLAQQYGDGVVNLNLGNVRPGEKVRVYLELVAGVESRDNGFRFRFPFALAPTYHAWAKAVAVRPGEGEMELPPDEFGDVLLPAWVEDPTALHRVGFDLSVSLPGPAAEIASPSHLLRVLNGTGPHTRVLLATGGDIPDRDLILDVGFKDTAPQVFSGVDNAGKGRFVAIIPSTQFGESPRQPARVAFVLDRSGSMQGVPMQQALQAVKACLGALSEEDEFGIVAFDNVVECFRREVVPATSQNREEASRFLDGIDARGGTELLAGTNAAAMMLAGGGDIFLLTDGQVGGTEAIVQQAKRSGIRVHCLGIGSASQDRLLSLLARETGGVSRFVTPRERVDMEAVELFAAAGRPVASDVAIEAKSLKATISPAPASTVFAGSPLVVSGTTAGEAEGALQIGWQADGNARELSVPLRVAKDGLGEVLGLLQDARMITDLEMQMEPGEVWGAGKRRESRVRRALEKLSLECGLTCPLTALVAVVEREGDMPGDVPKTVVVPVGMPQDVMFRSYFDGSSVPFVLAHALPQPVDYESGLRCLRRFDHALLRPRTTRERHPQPERDSVKNLLLELAGMLEPNGGLPGDTEEDRVIATVTLLLLFNAEGHTTQRGAFAPHVRRLVAYLEAADLSAFTEKQCNAIAGVLEAVMQGDGIAGNWRELARSYPRKGRIAVKKFWASLEKAQRYKR